MGCSGLENIEKRGVLANIETQRCGVCGHIFEDFTVEPGMPAVLPACLGAALILKAHLNANHTPD